jgi:hypothetical protein
MRYYVTIRFELHADTDQDAIEMARRAVDEANVNTTLETIHRAPFGQFGVNKEIYNHLNETT